MKGLGFKNYSNTYYRCLGIGELKNYRDENGYVDSYRKNEKLKSYINSLGESLNLPYYLVITLLADEKLKQCRIYAEYVQYVKTEFEKYINQYGSLKGIRHNDPVLYEKFRTMMKNYGDGTEMNLSPENWLSIFELDNVENKFLNKPAKTIDINPFMEKLNQQFGEKSFSSKDLSSQDYRLILSKAIKLAIPVKELFRNYGLNYKGNTVNRLSSVKVDHIPYLEEMRRLRDNLMLAQGYTLENGYSKEEIFEAKVNACQYAYNKYKNKMYNFTLDENVDELNTQKQL